MPHLKYTDESKLDLVRFSDFFLENAPHKATEAITKILETIDILKCSDLHLKPLRTAFNKI